MLHLMESAARPAPRRRGWMAVSTLVHAALIAGALLAGTKTVVARPAEPAPERLIFSAPVPAPQRSAGGTVAPAGTHVPLPRIVIPAVTVPITSLVIPTPTSFVDPPAHDGERRHRGIDPQAGPTGGPDVVFDRGTVDRAVAPLGRNPAPDYPATLRAAGVSGEVLVRFVVDTTGRVEPASIEIMRASHDLFASAVRRWLARTRYTPAQAAGVEVRQLVEQHVAFDLHSP